MNLFRNLRKSPFTLRKMGFMAENRDPHWVKIIGNREMVGYGINGLPAYYDLPDFPFPAIRWKETTPEIQGLYEKARGDWRRLSKAEKKALYRASFCQTFAEFKNHPEDWAEVCGITLILCSVGIWIYIYIKTVVYPTLPESFLPSRKRAQLRRQIDLQMNPIRGLSSYWDYDRMDWKRVTWSSQGRTPDNPFIKCEDDES